MVDLSDNKFCFIHQESLLMKRNTTLLIIGLAFISLSACGSPPAPETQTVPPSTPTDSAPAPTSPAAGSPTDSQPAPVPANTTVEIELVDNSITTPQTTFQAGVPYTFVIVNNGRHAHNFNVNTPVSVVGSMNAALDSALLVVSQSQLGVGDTATVEFTFPASAIGSQLEFSCLIRNHYEDGMFQAITVTP
jgi:uncharacterized cupredoxin-like copper-binding protein